MACCGMKFNKRDKMFCFRKTKLEKSHIMHELQHLVSALGNNICPGLTHALVALKREPYFLK